MWKADRTMRDQQQGIFSKQGGAQSK
jgi:hypothetical protein